MNTLSSVTARLAAHTLKDIEGLSEASFGFCRSECQQLPPKLPGSFDQLTSHLFLSTDIEPTQWMSKGENIPHFDEVTKRYTEPKGKVTAFYQPSPEQSQLLFKFDPSIGIVVITQFSGLRDGSLAWETKGTVACDRTSETFIFVCSHRVRDGRCGFCGPILVDLLRKRISEVLGPQAPVHVFPCSHLGGHVYAGNVLVYSRHGGVCFGCFCPSDIDALVDGVKQELRSIPTSLTPKVRGTMGYPAPAYMCKSERFCNTN